jgi:hypothetical protein
MNIKPLKKYAVKAREHFTEAIASRANSLGFSPKRSRPSEKASKILKATGFYTDDEIILILEELIQLFSSHSFHDVIERTSYTWFNRLVALRYMEVHGFLSHQILSHATDPSLSNLRVLSKKVAKFPHAGDIIQLKEMVATGKSNESIFRTLLISQCNELHGAMPFLFEEITLALSSLLPDTLLGDDSLIGDLVISIPESNWLEGVEIIGWLYQYYIAQRKRELTGKKLEPGDIPAATQLFTPRWIVRYLVQNTLGKTWLGSHRSPVLKSRWEYLMPEFSERGLTGKRSKGTKSRSGPLSPDLNPENLTILDPACGSGHILVEAFDTLKDMYLEMGYSPSEIAGKILNSNLYGLDIDERAAQMASFALLMRARIDNPKILNGFDTPVPHIYSLESVDKSHISAACTEILPNDSETVSRFKGKTRYGVPSCVESGPMLESISKDDFIRFATYFSNASSLGSLTIVPAHERISLTTAVHFLNHVIATKDASARKHALYLMQLVLRALLLCSQYDCVLANPPYLSSKYYPDDLRTYLNTNYSNYSRDMFSAFIIRNWQLTKDDGHIGFMSPFVWMFITSYHSLREFVLSNTTITSLIKLQYSAFDGATVPICTFTLQKKRIEDFKGVFINLEPFKGRDVQSPKVIEAITYPECDWLFFRSNKDFNVLPEKPLSFWLEDAAFEAFKSNSLLGDKYPTRVGIQTSNNARFIRRWFEVSQDSIAFDCTSRKEAALSGKKWFPYNKGGKYRQWYGNHHYIINFENDGQEISEFMLTLKRASRGALGDPEFQFRRCVTWSDVSSSHFGARYLPYGFISDISGSGIFPTDDVFEAVCCYLCSKVAEKFIKAINPTLHFQTGNISSLPVPAKGFESLQPRLKPLFERAVEIMKDEMSHYEENWTFTKLQFIPKEKSISVEDSIRNFLEIRRSQRTALESIENKNNLIFSQAFGLPEPKESESEGNTSTYPVWSEIDCVKRLISYGVGVILGRFRLDMVGIQDSPGAHPCSPNDSLVLLSKDSESDPSRDLYELFKVFIGLTFGKKNLNRNLNYLSQKLSDDGHSSHLENAESILRNYFFKDFFKDHVKMYGKRPLYWELSSGQKQSFKALTYCHLFTPFVLKTLRDKYLKPYYRKVQNLAENASANTRSTIPTNTILGELEGFQERLNLLISERLTLKQDDGIVANLQKISSIISEIPSLQLEDAA